MEWVIALIVRPFALLAILALVLPIRLITMRLLPDGKVKRLLLTPIKGYPGSDAWKRRLSKSAIRRP